MNRPFISLLLILNFTLAPFSSFARSSSISFQDLVLPSEVEGLGKSSGSVFYSPVVKDKPLIPVHVWGAVRSPGLHFVPSGTTLIEAVSMAGGPAGNAKLKNVRLTRVGEGELNDRFFNISDGGGHDAYTFELRPRDNIFIDRSFMIENRSFYVSLVGVAATILSSVLVVREIQRR